MFKSVNIQAFTRRCHGKNLTPSILFTSSWMLQNLQ